MVIISLNAISLYIHIKRILTLGNVKINHIKMFTVKSMMIQSFIENSPGVEVPDFQNAWHPA